MSIRDRVSVMLKVVFKAFKVSFLVSAEGAVKGTFSNCGFLGSISGFKFKPELRIEDTTCFTRLGSKTVTNKFLPLVVVWATEGKG